MSRNFLMNQKTWDSGNQQSKINSYSGLWSPIFSSPHRVDHNLISDLKLLTEKFETNPIGDTSRNVRRTFDHSESRPESGENRLLRVHTIVDESDFRISIVLEIGDVSDYAISTIYKTGDKLSNSKWILSGVGRDVPYWSSPQVAPFTDMD